MFVRWIAAYQQNDRGDFGLCGDVWSVVQARLAAAGVDVLPGRTFQRWVRLEVRIFGPL